MAEKLLIEFSGKKNLNKYARMLLAGEAGVGKTEFALTAPNPIWASAYPDFIALARKENTRYVNINNHEDLLDLYTTLRDGLIEAETLVVDRVDEIQRRLFINRMIDQKRDFLKNDDWNWIEAKMNQMAKAFCDLELNVIFVVNTRDQGGFDGQDFITKPDLKGGFAQSIYSYVDYAVNMEPRYIEGEEGDGEVVRALNGLRYEPSVRYPWVFDRTNTLKDLPMPLSYGTIVDLRETIELEEGNDPLEIVFQEIKDDEQKDTSVPGMSKADKLNKILNNSKKAKENNASINSK